MSDENMINNENDDTAALFVSTQKKKKAEEEAKKKAAEEQAQREAAEEEIRRMEQEVEERKKKAEEEKLALEREAASAKTGSGVSASAKAASSGKSKLPMFIGIGAAVAVIAVVAIVMSLGGGKDKTDYAGLQMNGEYTSSSEGFDIKMHYPDTLYKEVTEKKTDENLQIFFSPAKKGQIVTDVVISDLVDKDGTEVVKGSIALYSLKEMDEMLSSISKKQLESVVPGAATSEEKSAEYSAENPGKYTYSYQFSSDQYPSGAGYTWIENDSKGDYKVVSVFCLKDKEDKDTVTALRDTFFDKNSGDAFMMPGANPPESTDADELLEETTMHMGLYVPKDRFYKWEHTTNYSIWSDVNGCRIFVYPMDCDVDLNDDSKSFDYARILDALKDAAEEGINAFLPKSVESRTLLSDETLTEGKFGYKAEYKDVIGGFTYWERYYIAYWTDVKTEKKYWSVIITLVPEKNKDIYKPIFDRTLDTLQDI